jgi:hypothetical protein
MGRIAHRFKKFFTSSSAIRSRRNCAQAGGAAFNLMKTDEKWQAAMQRTAGSRQVSSCPPVGRDKADTAAISQPIMVSVPPMGAA